MTRRDQTPTVFGRAMIAFVCASVLLFNLFALGHARGVVATKHVQTAMMAAAANRPCPLTAQSTTVCTFAVFSTSALAEAAALPPPAAKARSVSHAFVDETSPAPRMNGTPFRPPREA